MINIRHISLIVIAIFLVSCGTSKPSNYYLLSDLHTSATKQVRNAEQTVVGVGPVTFSKYLNQPQIVTRNSLNKLHVDEFNRWGEPLDDNFTRVLGKNLDTILTDYHIAIYPWQHSEGIDYQVRMDVYRFDATTDGNVICDVRWEILKKDDHKRILSSTKTYHEFIGEKYSYTELANCMSNITARISRDIADDIRISTRKLPYP